MNNMNIPYTEEEWAKIQAYQEARKERLMRERKDLQNRAKSIIQPRRKETACDFLARSLLEVTPLEFYTSIFRGYLDIPDEMNPGAYTGIVIEKLPKKDNENKKGPKAHRYSVTDGFVELLNLIETSDNFCLMSPISYAGKQRKKENARYLFALAIDLDSLLYEKGEPDGAYNLFYQMAQEILPQPTYLVSSGTGIHVYYVFDEPIPLYRSNVRTLEAVRKQIVKLLWNPYVTADYKKEDIQWESLWQGFRVVGTKTKSGNICRAFRFGNGDTVSFNYLCSFIDRKSDPKLKPMPKHSYLEMKTKWPDWTKRHFDSNGRPLKHQIKKYWVCDRAVYDWFLNRITKEVQPKHRYHSLMCLAAYALKCDVSYEEFEKDCWDLFDIYEERTIDEENHWKKSDVESALKSYKQESLKGISVDAVAAYSGIEIKKNKRNGRKQKVHLEIARSTKKIIKENEGLVEGRPPKKEIVQQWRKEHPNGKKADCIRDTGLDKKTVYKWWSGENVKVIQKTPKDNQKQNQTSQINYDEMVQVFIKDLIEGASAADIVSKVTDPNANDKERAAVQSFVEATQRTIKNILVQNGKIEDDQKNDKKIENATNSTEII